jgi:hypothetical protein
LLTEQQESSGLAPDGAESEYRFFATDVSDALTVLAGKFFGRPIEKLEPAELVGEYD